MQVCVCVCIGFLRHLIIQFQFKELRGAHEMVNDALLWIKLFKFFAWFIFSSLCAHGKRRIFLVIHKKKYIFFFILFNSCKTGNLKQSIDRLSSTNEPLRFKKKIKNWVHSSCKQQLEIILQISKTSLLCSRKIIKLLLSLLIKCGKSQNFTSRTGFFSFHTLSSCKQLQSIGIRAILFKIN